MNPRRQWVKAGVAWPALAWMGALRAQANQPMAIDWLSPRGRDPAPCGTVSFNEGMAASGWQVDTR
jgi:hypothetical protein